MAWAQSSLGEACSNEGLAHKRVPKNILGWPAKFCLAGFLYLTPDEARFTDGLNRL